VFEASAAIARIVNGFMPPAFSPFTVGCTSKRAGSILHSFFSTPALVFAST